MQQDCLHISFFKLDDCFFVDYFITFSNYFSPFKRDYLSCIFINKVLNTGFKNFGGKFATKILFYILLGNFYFFCQTENIYNIFVGIESNSPKQGSYR